MEEGTRLSNDPIRGSLRCAQKKKKRSCHTCPVPVGGGNRNSIEKKSKSNASLFFWLGGGVGTTSGGRRTPHRTAQRRRASLEGGRTEGWILSFRRRILREGHRLESCWVPRTQCSTSKQDRQIPAYPKGRGNLSSLNTEVD